MTDCYYAVLEVECNATTSQIRKRYKRLALQRHPDKGGCAEAFKALSAAHRVLTDPEERAAYDAHKAEAANLAHENFEQEQESDDDESSDYDAEALMASMKALYEKSVASMKEVCEAKLLSLRAGDVKEAAGITRFYKKITDACKADYEKSIDAIKAKYEKSRQNAADVAAAAKTADVAAAAKAADVAAAAKAAHVAAADADKAAAQKRLHRMNKEIGDFCTPGRNETVPLSRGRVHKAAGVAVAARGANLPKKLSRMNKEIGDFCTPGTKETIPLSEGRKRRRTSC
jgi:curved DNA-binding protein CbpA